MHAGRMVGARMANHRSHRMSKPFIAENMPGKPRPRGMPEYFSIRVCLGCGLEEISNLDGTLAGLELLRRCEVP